MVTYLTLAMGLTAIVVRLRTSMLKVATISLRAPRDHTSQETLGVLFLAERDQRWMTHLRLEHERFAHGWTDAYPAVDSIRYTHVFLTASRPMRREKHIIVSTEVR